ncbi:FecR family protein [Ancylomarina euxinus]|nr:FecR family protein [Ancylomarina euxinus]MCZ4693806.1 FecR family protein [Ancylomarina euxinus]
MDRYSDEEFLNALPEIELPYSKSKDEIWNKMFTDIEDIQKPVRKIRSHWLIYSLAASLLLVVACVAFMRFYTESIYCPKGQHLAVLLPDNSRVELNANSNLTYHPYWWRVSREVKFEGEAFFNISKGSRFEIVSRSGSTSILGTSFNIYTRKNTYKVSCFTGKVRVLSTLTQDEVILYPKDFASINRNGQIELETGINIKEKTMWRDHIFFFTATPIHQVFEEIELQYDIRIVKKDLAKILYTGNFKKSNSVDEILNWVCLPLGLEYSKVSSKKYIVGSKQTK